MRIGSIELAFLFLMSTVFVAAIRTSGESARLRSKAISMTPASANDLLQRIDLRRAQFCELRLLPGIGPARAAAILRARERLGEFRSWADLDEVEGLGPVRLEQLRAGPVLPLPESPLSKDFRYNRPDAQEESEDR